MYKLTYVSNLWVLIQLLYFLTVVSVSQIGKENTNNKKNNIYVIFNRLGIMLALFIITLSIITLSNIYSFRIVKKFAIYIVTYFYRWLNFVTIILGEGG